MNKLITARTCPYGLKCWAYADMLGSDINRINLQGDEIKTYQRAPSSERKIPILKRKGSDLYDSNNISAWLLLEYRNYQKHRDTCLEQSDFDKYKLLDNQFIRVNTSLFKYVASGFSSVDEKGALDSTMELIKEKSLFHNERLRISFAAANLVGFFSRFMTYEEEFESFLIKHELNEWFAHVNRLLGLEHGEYQQFGKYFNDFVRSKQ